MSPSIPEDDPVAFERTEVEETGYLPRDESGISEEQEKVSASAPERAAPQRMSSIRKVKQDQIVVIGVGAQEPRSSSAQAHGHFTSASSEQHPRDTGESMGPVYPSKLFSRSEESGSHTSHDSRLPNMPMEATERGPAVKSLEELHHRGHAREESNKDQHNAAKHNNRPTNIKTDDASNEAFSAASLVNGVIAIAPETRRPCSIPAKIPQIRIQRPSDADTSSAPREAVSAIPELTPPASHTPSSLNFLSAATHIPSSIDQHEQFNIPDAVASAITTELAHVHIPGIDLPSIQSLVAAAMPREKPPTRSQLVVRKMRNKLMTGPALRFFLGRPVARVAKPALQFAANPEGKIELLAKDADMLCRFRPGWH
jgi:hypothetical protein